MPACPLSLLLTLVLSYTLAIFVNKSRTDRLALSVKFRLTPVQLLVSQVSYVPLPRHRLAAMCIGVQF